MRILPVLLLAGCATSTMTYGPDGEPLVFIECDSGTMTMCYDEARKRCPAGYEVVEAVNESKPGVLSTVTTRTLTVACQ